MTGSQRRRSEKEGLTCREEPQVPPGMMLKGEATPPSGFTVSNRKVEREGNSPESSSYVGPCSAECSNQTGRFDRAN